MDDFADHATTLVADVDCTAEGKPLCDANDVKGFPTIKHGDPANLETYEGGREFDDISKFAKGLKPLCSPSNRDLCEADDLKKIEDLEAVDLADLQKEVDEAKKAIETAESKYKRQVDSLQKKYERYTKTKDKKIKKIKDAGLGLKKSVLAYRNKQAAAENK